MPAKKKRLSSLTYGQVAEGNGLFHFLLWIQKESIPVPITDVGRINLVLDYLQHRQNEEFAEVKEIIAQRKRTREK